MPCIFYYKGKPKNSVLFAVSVYGELWRKKCRMGYRDRHFVWFMSDEAVGKCCYVSAEWVFAGALGDKRADVIEKLCLACLVCR